MKFRFKRTTHKNSIAIPRTFLLAFLLLISLELASFQVVASRDTYENGQLSLFRIRRQQPSGQVSATGGGQNGAGSSQQASSSGNSQGSGGETGQQDPQAGQADEKANEEVLASLKCDFGTSDSPDMCKFKIIESGNPLSKGMPGWSLGNGKLALYQGGPVMDAGDRNDTSGGYIFFETSNPYAMPANASTMSSQHQQQSSFANQHHKSADPYSIISTAQAFIKSNHRDRNNNNNNNNEASLLTDPLADQHLTSARVVVGQTTGGSSQLQSMANFGPAFVTPNLTAPGPAGMCLSFQYAIKGLSAEELRIHVNDQKTERSRQIWTASESAASNWTKGEVLYSATNVHSIMFSASSSSGPSSASKDLQQRKFRGYIALDEIDINKHEPAGSGEGACKGHCNFDGDLCGWTNAENGEEDDFDWSLDRGSDNLFTGPARDFTSSTNNELTGSYLRTHSGYPRRPGDRALLVSPMFQPTAMNEAMCMRFAVHMFGSGIGSLAIKIRYADGESAGAGQPLNQPAGATGGSGPQPAGAGVAAGQAGSGQQSASALSRGSSSSSSSSSSSADGKPNGDLVVWEMSGDAGNSWHQAQTSISSAKSQFQVLVEGVIGDNHLGDMAIDEISFSAGPCPTSPPVASKNYGDCTFEQSMCYWRNPEASIQLDDLDWIRSADEQSIHGPNFDHTLKKRSGSYLKLENTFREPKSGSRAFLLSPIFAPKSQGSVQCLSFYYYMFMRSISASGPNLGTIRVYLASNNELVPIWRLTNPISSPNWKHARASLSTALVDGEPIAPTKLFQIAFEGIWGDAPGGAIALDDITVFDGACEIMPAEAKSVPGECTFDIDMCSWMNKTTELLSASSSDSTDANRSPFLQSVNSNGGPSNNARLMVSGGGGGGGSKRMSWQLATVDSRPVNLQDHTYRAPIGYIYVDVLDSSAQRMAFPLQSAEVTVQAGQQVSQCLSFWFAAYGRQEANQFNVYLTQASAPPAPPEDSPGGQPQTQPATGGSNPGQAANSGSPAAAAAGGNPANPAGGSDADSENANAWKSINGKLIWSLGLGNITETNRRKWQYGQVSLKADSNYIVRFVAMSNDGGFALDDVSYYEGACRTRPSLARVQSEDDDDQPTGAQAAPAKPA